MQDDYDFETNDTREVRRKQPGNRPRTLVFTIICAVIFGLVAGGIIFGVNLVGNTITASRNRVEAEEMDKNASPAYDDKEDSGKEESYRETGTYSKEDGEYLSTEEVAAQCMSSMVTIATISVEEMRDFFYGTRSYEVSGAGTGVIVGTNDTELLIATNSHVVSGAKSVSVGFIDESTVEAYVKGRDVESDLAVVGVKLDNIPEETFREISIAKMGDSDALVLGQQVMAIGNALGYGQSVTVGWVSALDRELTLSDTNGQQFISQGLIQTDAAINSGNSGGALLNMKGELIGINEAKSSMTASGVTVDGVGYAIPISKAEPILNELMAITTKDKVPEDEVGYLGVNCADVTSDIAQMYNMPIGVCFTNVLEGSPAGNAGIKKGDVLVACDGRQVSTFEELKEVLTYYAAGESIEITVMRSDDGEYTEQKFNVVLASKEEIDALSANQ